VIHISQTPQEFHDIMHGNKRQVTVRASLLSEPLRAGSIISVSITDGGPRLPTIDCVVTHTHDCVLAYYTDSLDDEMITEPTVIASISRGIKW